MSAQKGGKRVQTISTGGAPPYGDVVNSALQDNAYALGWDTVAVPDNGHWTPGAQRQPGNVEPEPPGRVDNPARPNAKSFPDGTPTWLS
jgi:hypothetical protein